MNDPIQLLFAGGLVAAVLVLGYLNRAKFEKNQALWQERQAGKRRKRPKGPDGRTRRPKG